MSFQGPHNQPNQFFGPALAGACIAVVLSVPAAALTAAVFGSTYKIRALIYCTFLLWAVIGAILVYLKTWKAEKQPLSLGLFYRCFRGLVWKNRSFASALSKTLCTLFSNRLVDPPLLSNRQNIVGEPVEH